MMRLFALFLCMFLLLLFVGTVSYTYILWHTYWQRVAKFAIPPQAKVSFDETTGKFMLSSKDGLSVEPVLPNLPKKNSSTEDLPTDKVMKHVQHYQKQIMSQLRNTVIETGKSVLIGEIKNSYNVNYQGPRGLLLKQAESATDLLCDLRDKVHINTFKRGDDFFRSQQMDQYFPENDIFPLGKRGHYNSCAVVTSAGSLSEAKLGKHIDSHDFVIRFNNAPTSGFEKDVGSKTSLRIVNSQVVGKPEFRFLEARTPMYSSQPVLIWDPSSYNATLAEWYQNPDYPFFETYFSKRLMRPDESIHLLDPRSLWSFWDWLQSHTKWPLVPNPPSSGFIGLIIAMSMCRTVHVYEYVPSMRLTQKCHYYDEEINLGCTMGIWHPLAAEKLMAVALNVGTDIEVFRDGYLTITGVPGVECSGEEDKTS